MLAMDNYAVDNVGTCIGCAVGWAYGHLRGALLNQTFASFAPPREAKEPVPVTMGAKKYPKPELNPFTKVNFA